MTARADVDSVAKRLAEMVHPMMLAEVERLAQKRVDEKPNKAETDIMAACKAVAKASDALVQAQFAGAPEIPARRRLITAANQLRDAMQRHGRYAGDAA